MEVAGLIILAVLLLLFGLFMAGVGVNARHRKATGRQVVESATAADRDLAAAAAKDHGWDRSVMEAAVREAWSRRAGAAAIDAITLMTVIDPPGTDSDRAEFLVTAGDAGVVLTLARTGDAWAEAQGSASAPPSA